MKQFDPTRESCSNKIPTKWSPRLVRSKPVTIEKYSANQVEIKSKQDCAAWLVLADSYFPVGSRKLTAWILRSTKRIGIFAPCPYLREHTIRFKYSCVLSFASRGCVVPGGMLLLVGLLSRVATLFITRRRIQVRVSQEFNLADGDFAVDELIDLASRSCARISDRPHGAMVSP